MESSRARRDRRIPLVHIAALAVVAAVGATAAGTVYVQAQAHAPTGAAGAVSSSATPSTVAVSEEAPVERVAQPTADPDALLTEAMESVSVEEGAEVSVAVLDLASGASASYGDGSFDTASVVKVNVLAALLLQAQDAGRELGPAEREYAAAMIEHSDNDATSVLWETIGRAEGLAAANERFGLTSTEGGDGALWGLTQTTAADQLTLLRQVFGDESELNAASRTYLQELMGRIAAGQRWGVSAAADGAAWALKNGWLPRSTTGLWDINSIGRVTTEDGRDFLVAVLSDGHTTKAAGVAAVEAAARAAVSVLAESSRGTSDVTYGAAAP
ncbi:serine hydrolase [Streptomyces sp. TRM68416]|uniref:serine hydrolase n=1 Tax=Streptomyces sp. TRM68416 TaxID=2758412 RepID=UPI0016621372|nr:serine hydrolase [Streptomyces sp. TRM68416]MBD0837931.1 serine hydrolase [Streptomyces sp. TRM68416]